ncbi:MAG: DNA-binding protein [Lautropia sp.]
MNKPARLRATPAGPTEPFIPLERETRTVVPTDVAAFHLNRRPQTLRGWHYTKSGPIAPEVICGRLAWRVADLRRLIGAH